MENSLFTFFEQFGVFLGMALILGYTFYKFLTNYILELKRLVAQLRADNQKLMNEIMSLKVKVSHLETVLAERNNKK